MLPLKKLSIYKYAFSLLVLIIVIFFLLRLPSLNLIPVFADEAIYIRWAQVMKNEPTLRFLPLSDGKTPLFMWLNIPMFKLFSDPLIAGRMLSVFSGLFTLLGVWFLGWKFFDNQGNEKSIKMRVGLWGAFLISITPFFIFFDRMALVDSMLAAFSIWSLNFSLLLIKYPRFDLAMMLGYLFGGGLLTKPPAFFNILMLPTTLLLISWRDKKRQIKLVKLFLLWVIALIVTMFIYNILRLGPGFSNLNARNQDYVHSPVDVLTTNPLDPFIPHMRDVFEWAFNYLGLPLVIMILVGIGSILLTRNKLGAIVLAWGMIPLIIEMMFLKTFTARYVLFTVPGFIVVGALGIDFLLSRLRKKWLPFVIGFLLIFWPAYFVSTLLTDPAKAPLPRNERRGYLEEWTAGVGLKEIANYLEEESKKRFIVVGTEGYFGTLPDGLQIYLDKNRQVVVIGGGATVSAQLKQTAREHPTFFVANKSRYPQTSWQGVELIKEYPKAVPSDKEQDSMLFFRVLPENGSSISGELSRN